MTSIFFFAKEIFMKPILRCAKGMGQRESGKSALQGVYFAGLLFALEFAVSTTQRTAN
jgi:hypothetical protein